MSAEDRDMTDVSTTGDGQGSASATTAVEAVAGTDPIFNPVYAAKSELTAEAHHPSHLHPLHSSAQSLYSAPSDGNHLSRDQFRQLVAQLRHSISQFSATSPALQPASRSDAHPTTFQNQAETVTSDAVRRYISLLTEASTHTAALAHSVEPFRSTVASVSDAKTSASFPTTLLAGCLSIKQSKRPAHNWNDAVEALGALSDTIEQIGRNLGLEAFVEPAQDTTAPHDADASTLTHTLTLGAKIIVIDVEFRAVRQTAGDLWPKCRLNLSYANDSESTQRDPELGLCLYRDIQAIADRLFGISSVSQDTQSARESAIELLHHCSQNLAELAALDDLCAKANESSQAVDLFDAMQRLSAAMVSVHQAEAASASTETLLDSGHGISVLHKSRPFLQTTFAKDALSGTDYNLFLDIKPLSLSPSDKPENSIVPTLSPEAAKAVQLANPLEQLGAISAGTQTVPLYFVARLDPPVIVTRSTAANLASVCQLRQLTPQSTAAPAATPLSASPWFEDILSQSWSQRPITLPLQDSGRFTFTLARKVDSLRDPSSQGLVIDSIPLLTRSTSSATEPKPASVLSRLLAVAEILRDEVKLTELTRSAVASGAESAKASETAPEPTLDDLLAGTDTGLPSVPVTLSFRFPSSTADVKRLDNLMLELAFQVATKESTPRNAAFVTVVSATAQGWTVGADVRLSDTSALRLERDSSEARTIAAELAGSTALENVVAAVIECTEKQLGVQFNVPAPATDTATSFDPLVYEQANVHAVYETIAPHFSSTRYKPWPLIPAFLDTIPPGSVGADLGCGNGKYLPLRSTLALSEGADTQQNSLLTVGVDRSSNLVHLARDNFGMSDAIPQLEDERAKRRQEVAVGDAIQSSLRTGVFDYAISIATIHHFSTWERRRAAVQELIRITAPVNPPLSVGAPSAAADPRLGSGHGCGRFMIFVWALEQKMEGKRQFEAQDPESLKQDRTIKDPNNDKAVDRLVSYSGLTVAERRQQQEKALQEQQASSQAHVTDDQDVLVPWVLTSAPGPKTEKGKKGRSKNVRKNNAVSAEQELDTAVSELTLKSDAASAATPAQETPVYNRYYHVFRSGELDSLVTDAAHTMQAVHRRPRTAQTEAVDVVCEASGWERGNWWGVWRVQWAGASRQLV